MKYFGTDGIRDKANQGHMTVEMAVKAGRAFGLWLKQNNGGAAPLSIVIGQDTRVSSDMLAGAVACGAASVGVQIYLTKVMPTPVIAYLTKALMFSGGIVISASHNPYYDNGIKFFKEGGFKLSDADEAAVEALMDVDVTAETAVAEPGNITLLPAPDRIYGDFVRGFFAKEFLNDYKIVVDCANGAASFLAKNLFASLGATVISVCDMPNGTNINADCGSEHPGHLAYIVKTLQADAGFAFDGDADRVIAVDDNGEIINGDRTIAILAKRMLEQKILKNDTVVTTVMSNLGLKQALSKMGVKHIEAPVGDRNVVHEMLASGAVLGGEDSGHIIFLDAQTTGDGIFCALKLLETMAYYKKPLSELKDIMTIFPQKLINVNVCRKPDLKKMPGIMAAIANAETQLGAKGRVLVRYSGTQPMCRVMVEGENETEVTELCRKIADAVTNAIGC